MKGKMKPETLRKLVKEGKAYHCTSCGHVQALRNLAKKEWSWKEWKYKRCAKCHKRGTLETATEEDLE
jgi:glutamyl/glutaminyl-tRNA synthetase